MDVDVVVFDPGFFGGSAQSPHTNKSRRQLEGNLASWFAVGVMILGTLLATAYLAPVVLAAFFSAPRHATVGAKHIPGGHGEAPLPIVAALTLTAIGALVLFFYPNLPLALAELAVGGAP